MTTKISRSFEYRERFGEFFILEDRGYRDMAGNWNENYEVVAYCPREANAKLIIEALIKFADEECK